MFDTKDWLSRHAREAIDITDATWYVVGGLTLLWNLFEQRHCDKKCTVAKLKGLAEKIAPTALEGELSGAWDFWRTRYVENGATNNRFEGLHIQTKAHRDVVEPVLCGNATPQAQLGAMLVIVYRLRNNLFHGEKELPTLNEQRENLDYACRVLAATMELLGT
jgi:hypothetical protein